MRRLRTDGSITRPYLAAALALVALILERPHVGRAESQLSAPASFSPAKLERVGNFIRQEIAAGKMPGAIILIQQHGRPVYFECFGVRDVETRHPMTPDSIFRIYSMSKPITSVAAMMPLGEFRWDGVAGTFFFIDPRDDMFAIFMIQAPRQSGQLQLPLKTLIYEALGK
jgi:CubicO group peptidase (beta-lactamase class C family)